MELQIKDIRIHYGEVEAIKGVGLQIDAGETVSLLGANGAGKSTLLKAVSGLKKISSGEIWFRDRRIDEAPSQEIVRQGIIQVPEGRRLFTNMTVRENLLMGAYLRQDGRISESLTSIYQHFPVLEKRSKVRAGSLSGGEQQMLAISRALMAQPRIFLLDEPSIGLSPIMVAEITKVISDIGKGGLAIFLVEQNVRIAFKISHRGYVLETGRVVLHGKTSDLEKNEYVKKAYLGV
jgi:branched-chain amino acid transport system ATP-binding protein